MTTVPWRTGTPAVTVTASEAMAGWTVRTESTDGLDALARAAGAADWADLARRPGLPGEPGAVALAAATALLLPGVDPAAALDLLDRCWAADPASLRAHDVALYSQCLLLTGRVGDAVAVAADPRVPAVVRWGVRTDALHPRHGGRDDEAWRTAFAEPFRTAGLSPPDPAALAAGAPRLRDLRSAEPAPAAAPQTARGTVTVVMATHHPDEDLRTAVRSVLQQTWTDLELLLVDDASEVGRDLLEEVAGYDARVRLLRSPANRGTYAARNLALAEARGTWFTVNDADDWSHPRRLELQVAALSGTAARSTADGTDEADGDDGADEADGTDEADGAAVDQANGPFVGSRSWTLRAYPDLTTTWPGYPPTRPNASSLLIRTDVLREVGGFDLVRKSADVELPARLRAAGHGRVVDLPRGQVLAVTQLRAGSLSRADARPGWLHWSRVAYRNGYQAWHRRVRQGTASPVPRPEGARRHFPLALPSWSVDRQAARQEGPLVFDAVLVADWRQGARYHARTAGLARGLLSAGLRVGLAHLECPWPLAEQRQEAHRNLADLLRLPGTRLVHASTSLTTASAVLVEPQLLELLPGTSCAWDLGRLVAVLRPGSTGPLREDPRTLERWSVQARRWCGHEPVWVAAEGLEAELVPVDPAAPPPGALDLVAVHPRRQAVDGPAPLVLGHHLADNAGGWPRGRSALAAFFPDEGTHVLALHGLRTPTASRGGRPPTWFDLSGSGMRGSDLLGSVDVFVGAGTDVPPSALLQAAAEGCAVLVTPKVAAGTALPVRAADADTAAAVVAAYRAGPALDEDRALLREALAERLRRAAGWLTDPAATYG